MAGVTGTGSPLHEKMCVGFSVILGGAVASTVPGGTPFGAVAGFIIGVLICSRDVISTPIRNRLDFERAIDQVYTDARTQEKIIAKMAAHGIGSNREQSASILRLVVTEAKKNPDHYYKSLDPKAAPPISKINYIDKHASNISSGRKNA
jgi:hypothetical protein